MNKSNLRDIVENPARDSNLTEQPELNKEKPGLGDKVKKYYNSFKEASLTACSLLAFPVFYSAVLIAKTLERIKDIDLDDINERLYERKYPFLTLRKKV